MNDLEAEIYVKLKEKGFTVFRTGWPDFLCHKNNEVYAVEVKNGSDKIRSDQRALMKCLTQAGVRCFIARDKDFSFPEFKENLQTQQYYIFRKFWLYALRVMYYDKPGSEEHLDWKYNTNDEYKLKKISRLWRAALNEIAKGNK